MIRRPLRSTVFRYMTLFRSHVLAERLHHLVDRRLDATAERALEVRELDDGDLGVLGVRDRNRLFLSHHLINDVVICLRRPRTLRRLRQLRRLGLLIAVLYSL